MRRRLSISTILSFFIAIILVVAVLEHLQGSDVVDAYPIALLALLALYLAYTRRDVRNVHILALATLLVTASATQAQQLEVVEKDVSTDLELYYNLSDTAYRYSPVNVSILLRSVGSKTLYNISIAKVVNATIEKNCFIEELRPGETSWCNATVIIDDSVPLGNTSFPITINFSYYVGEVNVHVCKGFVQNNFSVTVCFFTNVTKNLWNRIDISIYPSANYTIELYRNSVLIASRSNISSATIDDPYPGPAHYELVAYLNSIRVLDIGFEAREAKIVNSSIETSFILRIIPRIVRKISWNISIEKSLLCLTNPATINDTGQLAIYFPELYLYTVDRDSGDWKLEKLVEIRRILANETKCIYIPWNLTEWPFLRAELYVWMECLIVDSYALSCRNVFRYMFLPFAVLPCDVAFIVRDDRGNPIERANIVFDNGSRTTDVSGRAVFHKVYPFGKAYVYYQDKEVEVDVFGCSTPYTVVIDLTPPVLEDVSSRPGEIVVRAYDSYSYVYALINGSRYGPFNGSISIPVPGGSYRVCIVDEFNNSAGCVDVYVEPYRPRMNYIVLSMFIAVMGAILYAAFSLIVRSE